MTINTNSVNVQTIQSTQSSTKNSSKAEEVELTHNSTTDSKPSEVEILFGSDFVKNNSELSAKLDEYIKSLSHEQLGYLRISMAFFINPNGIDANTDLPKQAELNKSRKEELFGSYEQANNFFSNTIQKITDDAKLVGENATHLVDFWQGLMNIFKSSEMKQQQEQYITLGQNQNNNG